MTKTPVTEEDSVVMTDYDGGSTNDPRRCVNNGRGSDHNSTPEAPGGLVASAIVDHGAHIDGCPACVVNTEAPTSTQRVPHGFQCAYRCTDCGQEWTTSWWGGSD